jgi:acyl-lipid omega-6 desaturase (Delta-12 desaturase)
MDKQNQRELRKQIAPYEKSNTKNSVRQMINTLVPFFALWILAYASLSYSYLITLAITAVAAGFLVRAFIIFHDCCHGSFFKNKRANNIIGTITGIMTFCPYEQWKHSHNVHHATNSNLNKRGTGDVWVLTVDEYMSSSFWTRLGYRLYRNPITMFIIGPIYVFLIQYRFNRKDARKKERINTYITNIALVAIIALFSLTMGFKTFAMIQGPIFLISGILGVWLFYVQHQFEDSYFETDENWDYVKAALQGSSYYKLPKVLQWITGNIGYHHIHHLSSRIPNYYLEEVHNKNEVLQDVPTINLPKSLESLKFKLWDEENKKFVSFKRVKEVKEKIKNAYSTSNKEQTS